MQHSPCNHHILNLFNNYPSHLPPSPTPLSLSTELHISQIPHRPPPPSPTPPPPSTWYLEETLKLKCQLRFHEYTKHWNLKHFTSSRQNWKRVLLRMRNKPALQLAEQHGRNFKLYRWEAHFCLTLKNFLWPSWSLEARCRKKKASRCTQEGLPTTTPTTTPRTP